MVSSVHESVQADPNWVTLLENVYGASETDRRVFAVIADVDGPVTVDEIAERIHRHRSTVSRSLTRLVDAGLIERMTRDDSGPSYRYVYRMRDADALADEMHRLLSAWYVRMDERIGEFARQSA
ncbi:MarR family transcriptional regulator [Haloarcula marina]|uniref:MarR family transcriptional regulator n=1 Tax=Haloarcula marina TaxID=2961574 RepID=UPI0020B70D5C|nr:MarR family transcriptional regulator [Halomicroarcula marina]